MNKGLDELRDKIDQIDDNIVDLLINRCNLSREVAEVKYSQQGEDIVIYRKEREDEIFKKVFSIADKSELYVDKENLHKYLESMYSNILELSREEQKKYLENLKGLKVN